MHRRLQELSPFSQFADWPPAATITITTIILILSPNPSLSPRTSIAAANITATNIATASITTESTTTANITAIAPLRAASIIAIAMIGRDTPPWWATIPPAR